MLDSSSKSTDKGVLLQSIKYDNLYFIRTLLLTKAGITIGSDNKLTVDEETFKKADMSTIKTLFHDSNSLAYNVSARASQINYYAQRQS